MCRFILALPCALIFVIGCENELSSPGDSPLTVVDLDELEAEDGYITLSLEADAPRSRIGLMLDLAGPEDVVSLEARGEGGAWAPVDITWREDALAVGRLDLEAPSERVELRFPETDKGALVDLRWSLLDPEETDDSGDGVIESNQVAQGLSQDLVNLGVHSRASWGARSGRCSGTESSKWRMAVHHTVTQQAGSLQGGRARMRQMQAFHMDANGWCDIGYHFVVSERGELFEARPLTRRGAHVGGSNSGNIGVSWMGCYHPNSCGGAGSHQVTEAMINGGGRLLHHLATRFGISRSSSTVKGHRDHPNVNKACPGDRLAARLGDLRRWEPVVDATPPRWSAGASLTRVSARGGMVRVRWPDASDDVGVDHYRLSAGGRVVTTRGNDARLDGLRPYARYTFRVVAVDAAGRASPALSAQFDTGAFVDISSSVFADAIERLARAGITVGCNPPANDRYCTNDEVPRSQMATFLTRALDLPSGPDVFVDDESSPHEPAINSIAAAGITRGCNAAGDRYCPDRPVTRAQMATFLTRALDLPAGPDAFSDDDGTTHEADINAIAAAGITHGCDGGLGERYCPEDAVTRGQMAAFLTRALGL